MVAFPSLEDLTIRDLGEHTTCIWGSSVSSTSFCKLKTLIVDKCSKLDSVIPVSMLNRLHNLEYIYIEDCSRLRNAFPPCIARDLIRLERMWITSCGMMTEIIGDGDQQKEKEISDNEDHDIIVFPKLTRLELVHLQNLTGFRAYQNGESNTCKSPTSFYREKKETHSGLTDNSVISSVQFQPLFDGTVAFPSLEDLSINYVGEHTTCIWGYEIQHIRQPRTSFSKLTILKIERCSAMKYLFCKSVAKCLGQLQELDISYCPAMEAIVMDEGTSDGEIIDLSKLRTLELRDLKSLRSFYKKNKEMHRGSADNSVKRNRKN